MYHKIAAETPTVWWVSADAFYRQMCDLSEYEVKYLDQYDPSNPKHACITFDGVYANVLTYAAPILKKFGYPFELFICGDQIGVDNSFDTSEPRAVFASISELKSLVSSGGRLQWHTKSHPNLSTIHDKITIEAELRVPEALRDLDRTGFTWLAYPYGEFNDLAYSTAKQFFRGAISCDQGDTSDVFRLNRVTVLETSRFHKQRCSLIIPSYNYGHLLGEAVESALCQTYPPDEILVIDDHSSDDSEFVGKTYAMAHPDRIQFTRNDSNLGIIKCFNRAVSLTQGEYVCFLGADNRFRSDYLEKTRLALNSNPQAAIAYTNFALFGERAEEIYRSFSNYLRGEIVDDAFYLINFPSPDSEEFRRGFESGTNFIHGSSLYTREAFNTVGGYRQADDTDKPEDFFLFFRIMKAGFGAIHIAEPLLEYRQHSSEQANTKLTMQAQLSFYRKKSEELIDSLALANERIAQHEHSLRDASEFIARKETEIRDLLGYVRELERSVKALESRSLFRAFMSRIKGT